MKKRIISMAISVVVAISALPLFSSCSGGIGGTNINQELVKDFELNQSDIEILVKPFEVANQARNELNSKNEITNDDLEDFNEKIHDAFSSTGSDSSESDTPYNSDGEDPIILLRNKLTTFVSDNEASKKWSSVDDLCVKSGDLVTYSLFAQTEKLTGNKANIYIPIQRYNETMEFLNLYSELLYGKKMIAEDEIKKISESNIGISYKEDLVIVTNKLVDSCIVSDDVCKLTKKVWYNSIHRNYDTETDAFTLKDGYFFYDDFNDALNNLFNDETYKESVEKVNAVSEVIKKMMKYMKDAPEEYTSAYDELQQFYSAYQSLSDLAVDVNGSYNSYSDNVSDAQDNIIKCYNKLKLYID